MKKKNTLIGLSVIATIAISILAYMYFDTTCKTYIIEYVPQPESYSTYAAFETEDSAEAISQIEKIRLQLTDQHKSILTDCTKDVYLLTGMLIERGYSEHEISSMSSRSSLPELSDTAALSAIIKLRDIKEVLDEETSAGYYAVMVQHNHFCNLKNPNWKKLLNQNYLIYDKDKQRHVDESSQKKYRMKIYMKSLL